MSIWWIVLVVSIFVAIAPMGSLWIQDKIKPMDIVNDYGIERRIWFAVKWLVVFGFFVAAWMMYGVSLVMLNS